MQVTELPDPEPSHGEVLVDVARAGVNFADTHATRNEYIAEQTLPMIPGSEVSGVADDGKRVAAVLRGGGYAERVAVPSDWLVPVPDEVSDDQAAALLIQGITAHALVHRCAHLQPGETVVIEAAAGGTGGLALQLAKRVGARVIALASSEEKRAHCARLGADATVDSMADDFSEAILAATGGERVDAVLHMSGERFSAEFDLLAPLGRIVVFGNASKASNELRTNQLLTTSRAVIGFWLYHLLSDRDAVGEIVADLFRATAAGELDVVVGGVYPLDQAAQVHEELVRRATSGKLLLDPSGAAS